MSTAAEDAEARLLSALGTYKLLNYAQMRRVGVANREATVAATARLLHRKRLIGRTEGVLVSRVTALPQLHWLTPKGARELAARTGIQTRGATRRFGDMHEVLHRVGIVDIHIALRAWAGTVGIEVAGFVGDFDPGAARLGKATGMQVDKDNFVPDALAWLRLPGEDQLRLLVIEFERGGHRGDLSEFFRTTLRRGTSGKLARLRDRVAKRHAERAFDLADQARYLVVFKDDQVRGRALERWAVVQPDDPAWQWFFCKSLPEVAAGFGRDWHQPGRPPRPLFRRIEAANLVPA